MPPREPSWFHLTFVPPGLLLGYQDHTLAHPVASTFYRSLFGQKEAMGREGHGGPDVARAVREAVMAVRETETEMPLAWAQFVHFGA